MKVRKYSENILVFGVFFALVSSHPYFYDDLPYVVMLVSIALIFPAILIQIVSANKSSFKSVSAVKMFATKRFVIYTLAINTFILISWGYGVIVAIENGVESQFYLRNFFGLLLYGLFLIFIIVKPSVKPLLYAVLYASLIQICYGIESVINIDNTYALAGNIDGLSGLRSMYSTGYFSIFPLLTLSLSSLIFKYKKTYINTADFYWFDKYGIYLFVVAIFGLVVPAMSKGFILAVALLLLFYFFVFLMRGLRSHKVQKKAAILAIALLTLSCYLVIEYWEMIIYTFSSNERSNSVRSEQANYLISEFTFIGAGLGAALESGYSRGIPYGFELTYLNIIHKLGFMSIFLFIFYATTVYVAIVRVIKKIQPRESSFALGAMGYLIVGIGNPVLLSPVSVILHCIAVYSLCFADRRVDRNIKINTCRA